MDQEKISELAKAERKEYLNKWRGKNKDKVKKHNATYWEKRAKAKTRKESE